MKARRQGETLVIQVALALDHAVAKHLLVTTEKSVILDDSDNHALEYKEKKVLL